MHEGGLKPSLPLSVTGAWNLTGIEPGVWRGATADRGARPAGHRSDGEGLGQAPHKLLSDPWH